MLEPHERNVGIVVLVIALMGASFWGGMQYQAHAGAAGNVAAGTGATMPVPGTMNDQSAPKYGSVFGEVASVSGSRITVKGPDGKTQDILVGATTTVTLTRVSTEPSSALRLGDQITALGALDGSGRLTASSIQVTVGSGAPAIAAPEPVQ